VELAFVGSGNARNLVEAVTPIKPKHAKHG
jgi:hypothetical protein